MVNPLWVVSQSDSAHCGVNIRSIAHRMMCGSALLRLPPSTTYTHTQYTLHRGLCPLPASALSFNLNADFADFHGFSASALFQLAFALPSRRARARHTRCDSHKYTHTRRLQPPYPLRAKAPLRSSLFAPPSSAGVSPHFSEWHKLVVFA